MIFIQNMICTWVFACLKMHVMGIFDPALKNINEFFTIDIDDWVGKDTPSFESDDPRQPTSINPK